MRIFICKDIICVFYTSVGMYVGMPKSYLFLSRNFFLFSCGSSSPSLRLNLFLKTSSTGSGDEVWLLSKPDAYPGPCNAYTLLYMQTHYLQNVYTLLCNVYTLLCNVYTLLCNVYTLLCTVHVHTVLFGSVVQTRRCNW